mmetsp:Transcript_9883/g.14802  ORF Transcript_9883/g.14802 Transcript_9883/m.14802 type:complete len:208 (-) Transcript_9883:181-804(-)
MISTVLSRTPIMERYDEPENDEADVYEGNNTTHAHLHAYYEPIKDCKPRMTASSSSTMNLDSLLASITDATESSKCRPSDSRCLTTSTSLCTSLASSTSCLSTTTTSFSLYADGKRKKSRGLSRSIRYSSHLSSLQQCPPSPERSESSIGTKRSLDEFEGPQWGYFVDTPEEPENDYYDIDFSDGPIARVLDHSSWEDAAGTSVDGI